MDYYEVAEKLAINLDGKVCFTSRVKEQQINGYFLTLHSLVYKVLRKSKSYGNVCDLKEKLSGEEMYQNVKNAVANTGVYPSKEAVLYYYYSLRTHQNYGTNIKSKNGGLELLNNYHSIKDDSMDWEESMQLATWYLKQDIVHSLYNFSTDNIILLQPELLNQKRNKNALDFFLALCQWSSKHTNWNIYYVTNRGKIYYYKNGSYQWIKGDCQWQSPFFV